ncbi:MAG TPA: RidA family protein [Azospirillaceae bacterium]|nr:RidA family protein [Azospirillaceae bacterium]
MPRLLPTLAALAVLAVPAATLAEEIVRTPVPDFPISAAVVVPPGAELVYLSGAVPPVADTAAPKDSVQRYGDTETQTLNVLKRIEQTLAAQGLGFKDIVSMHVFLVGDPATENRMDFAGMMRAYTRHFGTPEQPNKPARTTVQVAGLAAPGMLVEIEVVAARVRQ